MLVRNYCLTIVWEQNVSRSVLGDRETARQGANETRAIEQWNWRIEREFWRMQGKSRTSREPVNTGTNACVPVRAWLYYFAWMVIRGCGTREHVENEAIKRDK